MKKNYTDPFSPNVDSTLPPRGTGLESGTAGERREGTPRTEEEREKRHATKTKEESFKVVVRNGVKYNEIESYKPSVKEQWMEYHKRHGK